MHSSEVVYALNKCKPTYIDKSKTKGLNLKVWMGENCTNLEAKYSVEVPR